MSRRNRLLFALGLAIALSLVVLVWRATRNGEFPSPSPLASPSVSSPLSPPTATPFYSPLPVPPTGTPLVNMATLEAIRAAHPTATPPAPSGTHWPYISPATWRRWALWILAAAGVLMYIGLRLRRGQ